MRQTFHFKFVFIFLLNFNNYFHSSTAQTFKEDEKYCRHEGGQRLPYDTYVLDTCARCYNYMPSTAFKEDQRLYYFSPFPGSLYDPITNRTLYSNETLIISQSFISKRLLIKWQQCCTDAVHCCLQWLQFGHKDSNMCPRTWDGWSCWPEEAHSQQTLKQSCPKHIYWHQIVPPCRGYTTKQCNSSGNWFTINGKEWTNYSMCARDDIYVGRIRYSIVTNVISMCTLIPALFIFRHYKQLSSVSRIRLHKHLFTSLFFHALVSSLLKWHLLSISESDSGSYDLLISLCLLLSILLRYFRSTTYLWMFNEALYLHQLIKHAFTQPPLTPLITLAYVLPATTTLVYIILRVFVDGIAIGSTTQWMPTLGLGSNLSQTISDSYNSLDNNKDIRFNDTYFDSMMEVIDEYEEMGPSVELDKCWLMPSPNSWIEWIINAPNLAILIVNCIFLVLLLRVLCIKASSTMGTQYNNSGHINNSGVITRQSIVVSLRAAILLLPLYGLHYLFVVYRPHIENCWFSEVYNYFSLTLDGLQGCAVSIIFCFANNEIRYLLTRSLERVSTRPRSTTICMTEVVATQHN